MKWSTYSSQSMFFDSFIGLKQGDPSSPLMFMFFINDITQNINVDLDGLFSIDNCILFMLLYADDAVVFSKSPEGLQSILNDLDLYCRTWGLKNKCFKNQNNDLRKRLTH